MLNRLIGLIILLVTSYVLLVFLAPDIADTYGNKSLNTTIRNIKNQSLNFASGADTPQALVDKIGNSVQPMLDSTKKNIDNLNVTVGKKVQQAREAGEAMGEAYDAVQHAGEKIKNVTNFNSGTTQ